MRVHVGRASSLRQNRQWHLHLNDLFDDSLWDMLLTRELRLRTIVFAGADNVSLSSTECCSPSSILGLRSSFDFSVDHLGVILLLVLGLELMPKVAVCSSGFRCTLSCNYRVSVVSFLRCFATGASTVVSQCTDTMEYLPFSVPFESKHLSLLYSWNFCNVMFDILLDCGGDLLLVAAVSACVLDLRPVVIDLHGLLDFLNLFF